MKSKKEEKNKMIYPNSDLKTSLVYPLYLTSKELIRKYNELLKKYDVTYTQYLILMYFFHEKRSNLKNIGKALMLDSSTLTPLLKKLEMKGLITRSKSTIDERNLQIEITKEGLALKPKLKAVRKKMDNTCDMSKEEIANLHNLLLNLLCSLVEDTKNNK